MGSTRQKIPVYHLSQAQLARKRANDRVAQRNKRINTQRLIDELRADKIRLTQDNVRLQLQIYTLEHSTCSQCQKLNDSASSGTQSVVPRGMPAPIQTTWVPIEYSTVEGNSSVQLVPVAEREKWHLSVASRAGCLTTPPDYDQLHSPLSNDLFGSILEDLEEATQLRLEVHSPIAWERTNGGFEHARLNSSACFSDGNSAKIYDGLDIHNGTAKLPENWGEREWGEVLKGLPQGEQTDGGFREYAGQDIVR